MVAHLRDAPPANISPDLWCILLGDDRPEVDSADGQAGIVGRLCGCKCRSKGQGKTRQVLLDEYIVAVRSVMLKLRPQEGMAPNIWPLPIDEQDIFEGFVATLHEQNELDRYH